MLRRALSVLTLALAASLCACALALGQGAVLQGGAFTQGHPPMYDRSGQNSQVIVTDPGTAAGGAAGLGLSEMLQVNRSSTAASGAGPFGTHDCRYSAPVAGLHYYYLCFDANGALGGLLAYGAIGMTALPLNFTVNGINYQFPYSIGGIVGPSTSVVNDMACWNNTSGNLLKDCGPPLLGPGTTIVNDLACWNNTTGTLLKDCGVPLAVPGSTIINDMACWNSTTGAALKDCGVPITGPGTTVVGDQVCWNNTTGTVLSDCGTPPTASVLTVATNAALKALTGGAANLVVRTGYAANGDTPAAQYWWNASSTCTDDGGSCIQPNVGSGRWILTAQPRVPSGVFGALCNGVHDDTTALNNAIAYVQGLTGPGNILLLQGSCIISSSLNVTNNMGIEGAAMNSTFITPNSTSVSCINFNPSVANRTLNLRNFTCTYASLSPSGATGIQYGNQNYNNVGGNISWIACTNCAGAIQCLNCINVVIDHTALCPCYSFGIQVTSPLAPDAGGVMIHDSYIETFAPANNGLVGIEWFSGGAFNVHDNQVLAPTGIYLHESLQTSELWVHHNLIVGTGAPTAGIIVDAISASFTCSQSGTNLTTSAVTGQIVTSGLTYLGATTTCNGTAVGTIVSQSSGTPGGAGVYVTTGSASTSGAGLATLLQTEVNITGNILDGTVRPLYVPQNPGGVFMNNLNFSDNVISSDSNAATNQITVFDTLGLTVANNTIKCNGNCAGGRPIFIDSSVSKATIWQPRSAEPGTWGLADIISSTSTCGMSGNALLTSC